MSKKRITDKYEVDPCFHFLYIDNGYRANHSFWDAFSSLFSFHNETMNIWSHFIGFLCVLIVGVNFLIEYIIEKHLTTVEWIALEIYFVCAAACLLFSTCYHLFGCLSEKHHFNLLRLDLTGVAFLVAGSFIPGVFFGFHCLPDMQYTHLILSFLVLIVGLIAPWIEYKVYGYYIRPYILASLVVVGLYPCIHWSMVTPEVYTKPLAKVSSHHDYFCQPS